MDSSPSAFIPDRFGLAVVDVAQLIDYLLDGDDLETAIANSAFDSVTGDMDEHVARLRQLNETGDAAAYWNLGNNAATSGDAAPPK